MLARSFFLCIISCSLVLFGFACGHRENPVNPQGLKESQFSNAHQFTWGTYDIAIDPLTGEADVNPIRTLDFTASVVRFLQPPIAPIELVSIKVNPDESELANGLAVLDITLRHPFPSKPIFRGFDVHGIILADGETVGKHDPNVKFYSPVGTRLLNPDGFTRWWNQVEFTSYGTIFGYTEGHFANKSYNSTATVNPYKLHTPSLDKSQPVNQMDLLQRATFPVIDGYSTRRYKLQFDPLIQPLFRFKYSISANWSLPDPSYAPYYPIEAYDLKANCQEPYILKIEYFEEIPFYVDEYVSGGNLIFNLTIGDWQATDGNVLDQISHVWLESPSLFPDTIDVKDTMEFFESKHSTQATFRISLEDMLPNGLDGQQLLITVESTDPDTYAPQIDGNPSAFDYPDGPLAAYLVVDVPITNLQPQSDYAYVYFIPDWCATMRKKCDEGAGNQQLMANIMSQNIDGFYNDFTHVQLWEGKVTIGSGWPLDALPVTCSDLGYSLEVTKGDYFDSTGSRVIIAVLFSPQDKPPDPPFTYEEAMEIQEFIDNGGILFFLCEASKYFNDEGLAELFGWLGMLMEYGGGATPELSFGQTDNVITHWLTEGVTKYQYLTCGQWITDDPHVLTLVSTEYDE
ncbi:MAG: hypothetical protein ABIC40_00370, partial [bacterium]